MTSLIHHQHWFLRQTCQECLILMKGTPLSDEIADLWAVSTFQFYYVPHDQSEIPDSWRHWSTTSDVEGTKSLFNTLQTFLYMTQRRELKIFELKVVKSAPPFCSSIKKTCFHCHHEHYWKSCHFLKIENLPWFSDRTCFSDRNWKIRSESVIGSEIGRIGWGSDRIGSESDRRDQDFLSDWATLVHTVPKP